MNPHLDLGGGKGLLDFVRTLCVSLKRDGYGELLELQFACVNDPFKLR